MEEQIDVSLSPPFLSLKKSIKKKKRKTQTTKKVGKLECIEIKNLKKRNTKTILRLNISLYVEFIYCGLRYVRYHRHAIADGSRGLQGKMKSNGKKVFE